MQARGEFLLQATVLATAHLAFLQAIHVLAVLLLRVAGATERKAPAGYGHNPAVILARHHAIARGAEHNHAGCIISLAVLQAHEDSSGKIAALVAFPATKEVLRHDGAVSARLAVALVGLVQNGSANSTLKLTGRHACSVFSALQLVLQRETRSAGQAGSCTIHICFFGADGTVGDVCEGGTVLTLSGIIDGKTSLAFSRLALGGAATFGTARGAFSTGSTAKYVASIALAAHHCTEVVRTGQAVARTTHAFRFVAEILVETRITHVSILINRAVIAVRNASFTLAIREAIAR